MEQNFTQDHLILFLYNELEEHLKAPLLKQLSEDINLQSCYAELKRDLDLLDSAKIPEPSATSIQIILEESSSELTTQVS